MLRPFLIAAVLGQWLTSLIGDASAADQLGLYVIDIESGKVTTVTTEPLPGHNYCGSPGWSPDGKRLLMDVTPGREWTKSRVMTSDFPVSEKPAFFDLGKGNCPSWSPDGKRIAFLLNPGAVPDGEPGLWIMDADGTDRRRVADGAIPKWSPDGKHILSVTFSNPCQLTLVDVETGEDRPVLLADHEFYSVPSWAGDGQTLVAVVRSQNALSIALVDVGEPAKAAVKQVLWIRGGGTGDEPLYPVFAAKLKRCAFIGRSAGAGAFALYVVDDKSGGVAKLLEPALELKPEPKFSRIAGLAISPAGDKLLFGAERQTAAK